MVTARDIQLVEDYLAAPKTLEASLPEWSSAVRDHELQAIWNVEEDGGRLRSHLRVRVGRHSKRWPSVSLIFRSNPIWRVDIKPDDVCEGNPLWAFNLGLDAQVCGTHCHTWVDNRQHILASGLWELPARRNIAPQVRRLPQVMAFMAEELNIELTHEQRGFDTPPRRDLFDME
jgi:hypothetical protein